MGVEGVGEAVLAQVRAGVRRLRAADQGQGQVAAQAREAVPRVAQQRDAEVRLRQVRPALPRNLVHSRVGVGVGVGRPFGDPEHGLVGRPRGGDVQREQRLDQRAPVLPVQVRIEAQEAAPGIQAHGLHQPAVAAQRPLEPHRRPQGTARDDGRPLRSQRVLRGLPGEGIDVPGLVVGRPVVQQQDAVGRRRQRLAAAGLVHQGADQAVRRQARGDLAVLQHDHPAADLAQRHRVGAVAQRADAERTRRGPGQFARRRLHDFGAGVAQGVKRPGRTLVPHQRPQQTLA